MMLVCSVQVHSTVSTGLIIHQPCPCLFTEPCSYEGAVQLVGGIRTGEGTVQVCIAGVWGTVCDDYWGSNDAKVVCRQLGIGGDGNNN